jgi:hypothetical protein
MICVKLEFSAETVNANRSWPMFDCVVLIVGILSALGALIMIADIFSTWRRNR